MRLLSPLAIASIVVGASCSTPSGGATHPRPTGSGEATAHDAAAAPLEADHPTAAECTKLFAHAVAIRVGEQSSQPPPTEAEQADLRARLETEAGAECRAGTRATYECGIAAKTLAELEACR